VYQAVRPILFKQPGDVIPFVVEREGRIVRAEVVLAGGVELPAASFARLDEFVQPKLRVAQLGTGLVASQSEHSQRPEFLTHDEFWNESEPDRSMAAEDKLKLLQKALARYQNAIVYLQGRLQQEQVQRAETESMMRGLQKQIDLLRAQIGEGGQRSE
jgi:hypothetical protein